MNQVQATAEKAENKGSKAKPSVTLRDVRNVVDDVRGRAEVAFRHKPYLLPVAAGAVGLGVGLFFGSRIVRFVVLTAVGGVLSEALGGELRRIASASVAPEAATT